MQLFIQKNVKKIVIVAVAALVMIGGIAFASADEIFASLMPNASELQVIYCELDQMRHEYTGNAIEPKIVEIALQDKDGETMVKLPEEFTVTKYIDNIEQGLADIEVSINGYGGTIIVEDAFYIYPAKVTNLMIEQASMEGVNLKWDAMHGVNGYYIFKCDHTDEKYTLIHTIEDGSVTTYQDTSLAYNQTYSYKVGAYFNLEKRFVKEVLDGQDSDSVKYYTPLSTPVITGVSVQGYNSLNVTWENVAGAIGYQVFKSNAENGEFTCIADIADGNVINYVDNTCECGVPYFYYVKAVQAIENEKIYGEASAVVSGSTVPNQTNLRGSVSNGETQVNLSWNKSAGAVGYEIYRTDGDNGNYKLVQKIEDANVVSWVDSGLSKDHEHRYRIRPYCVVNGKTVTGNYSNSFLKEVVIVFNYTPGEVSENMAKVLSFQGTPYVWGGKTNKGWDCSGFTSWTMQNCFGITIPKSAAGQAGSGTKVSLSDRSSWQPGDILCYSDGRRVTHVAMYIGNGQLMHALNTKYDTFIQGVDYYETWDTGNRLVAVRRYFN